MAPGIVVILLARELLITTLRGNSESGGKNFGAALSGKVKMVFQSCTILAILLYVNYVHWLHAHADPYVTWLRDFGIWGTVAITLVSGAMYVQRAMAMYREEAPR